MFPCLCPSLCGTLWHPASVAPPCQHQQWAGVLGDTQAIRTEWAFAHKRPPMPGSGSRMLDSVSQRSVDPMSLARVIREGDDDSWLSMTTIRSLDDIFEFRIFHSLRTAFVEVRSSKGGPSRVYSATFVSNNLGASKTLGTGGLPDTMRISSPGEDVFDAISVKSPSASPNLGEAADRYNDGGNWIAVARAGYEGGLTADAHAILCAIRKVHIALILDRLRTELGNKFLDSDGQMDDPDSARAFADIRRISDQYGIETTADA